MRSTLLLAPLLLLVACQKAEDGGSTAASTAANSHASAREQADLSGSGDTATSQSPSQTASDKNGGSAADSGAGMARDTRTAVTPEFKTGGPISDADLANYVVRMECSVGGESVGAMEFEFWPEKAPVSVRNFLRYCSEGFYKGLTFHRVIKGFMIQGGDPRGTGSGSGPNGTILGEFPDNPRYDKRDLARQPKYKHLYGVLSMARTNDMNSATSQFFVCNANATQLDQGYASFGKMISGKECLDAISNVQTGAQDRPAKPCVIESVSVFKKEG